MGREASDRRALVFGATGQVGHELPGALARLGAVVALDRNAADLARPETLRAVVRRHRPHVIVNAAAYTAVDRAEGEPDLARLVNVVAPGVLAEEAEALDAAFVHYSTDYVFDGRRRAPYVEGDDTNPLSVYGRTKLAGEQAVARACRRHLIFRTSWVVGGHGSNFVKTILRLAAERDTLRVVDDQCGAPTSATLIAGVTAQALEATAHAQADDARWGVYHLAAGGETSWCGCAVHTVRRARARGAPLRAGPDTVVAIATSEYPTAAARPANSRLDTTKLRTTFKVDLPDWREGVNAVVDQLVPDDKR